MAFVWKADRPLLTEIQIARIVHEVSQERRLDELASVLALMCIRQESAFWCPANHADPSSFNYPHDSVSDDGRSVGYYQQQNGRAGDTLPPGDRDNWWGPMACRMDLRCSTNTFLERLSDNYRTATTARQAGDFIQAVQRSGYPRAYDKHWDYCWALLRRALNTTPDDDKEPPVNAPRPDYNEFPIWTRNNHARNIAGIDLFLIHTQQGGGGDAAAENLAKYLKSTEGSRNPVSYHYTISQASDGGVTVVDCVDTDRAAWSVGNANNRSINLCFAGSYAEWTREQWMRQANAIDVAAYLAVQDARKYKFDPRVIPPPYDTDPPGISDHRYVTQRLKWGSHWDVGDGFPWDYFTERVQHWVNGGVTAPEPAPAPPGTPKDAEYEVLAQTRGRWEMLGDQTVVEALAEIRDAVTGSSDAGKPGFRW